MNGQISKTLLVATLLFGCTSAAKAYPSLNLRPHNRPLPSATALVDAEPAMPPFAFLQFCMAYRSQCEEAATSLSSFTLDSRSWEDLQRVNREVNDAIAPDAAKGSDDWSLETRFGNCNDYAVQKRDALIKLGYPIAALSLAVVKTAFGEGHLVLTVRTDRGDLVLDNRRPAILGWNRTGYAWIKRQSVENPQYWVAVSTRAASRGAPSTARAPAVSPAQDNGRSARQDRGDKALAVPAATLPASSSPAPELLPVGLANRVWDAAEPFQAVQHPVETGINHVAAGRQLAMLAFDDLGGWLPHPPVG